MKFTAVCSAKTRPMTQSARSYSLKTGAAAWGRDVFHIRREDDHGRTVCGVDCSEWLLVGEVEDLGFHCCERCKSKL